MPDSVLEGETENLRERGGMMAGEQILVVDYTGFNLILIEKSLAELECKVEQAASAADALQLLSKQRFDLVITDLMMPDMNGVDFYREAHATKHFDDNGEIPVPPFILCTAFHDKDVVESAVKEGFVDIVLKPVERARMVSAVEKALAGAQTEISIKVTGDQAAVLSTLAEMAAAEPQEILNVLLQELALLQFPSDINSLEKIQAYFHKQFSPVVD